MSDRLFLGIDGGGTKAYEEAHIPGSIHSDYDKDGWRVTRNDVPFMLPSVAQLEKLIGDLGIDEDSHVVVVPAGVNVLDFGSAARAYWTLKYAGVKDVSILDGGVAAWRQAGFPVESALNHRPPAVIPAGGAERRRAGLHRIDKPARSAQTSLCLMGPG